MDYLVDMEKETELLPSRKSLENGVVQLKPLQPLPVGKVALFKLPQMPNNNDVEEEDDDDDDAISLKEWQPSPRSPTVDANGTPYSAWKPVREESDASFNGNGALVKDSARSRPVGYSALVESNGGVCLPPSIHGITLPAHNPSEVEVDDHDDDHDDDPQDDDQVNGTYEDGLDDDLEDEDEAQLTEPDEADHHRPKAAHHQHSISLVNGIAPPPSHPTGGIAFDISLDDHDDSQPRCSTGSSRGTSLRVSFINEVVLDSPSPPRNGSKSPFRPRNGTKSPSQTATPANGKPEWDSSAKIGKSAPPMPKKFVRPTLHGIKVKKGQGGVAKTAIRASTSVLETGFAARDGRSKVEAVGRSWDSQQFVGGEYDSVSQLISKSLVSEESNRKEDSGKPARPFVPRSNGNLKAHEDGEVQNGSNEVIKPKEVASNGTNKSTGDFSKLFSKLRRASTPSSKPPSKSQPAATPKPSAPPVIIKMPRANSVPVENPKLGKKSLAPLHSLDSSGADQKYAIGSYASLKLLQECAQTEKSAPIPASNTHKPRKIRDHEPHRHYYKTISKTLDSKLKS